MQFRFPWQIQTTWNLKSQSWLILLKHLRLVFQQDNISYFFRLPLLPCVEMTHPEILAESALCRQFESIAFWPFLNSCLSSWEDCRECPYMEEVMVHLLTISTFSFIQFSHFKFNSFILPRYSLKCYSNNRTILFFIFYWIESIAEAAVFFTFNLRCSFFYVLND